MTATDRFRYRPVPMPFGSDRASDEWAAAYNAWRENDRLSWLWEHSGASHFDTAGLIGRGIRYLRTDPRLAVFICGWNAYVKGAAFGAGDDRLSYDRFVWRAGWAFAQRAKADLEWDDWRNLAALACELPAQLRTWEQTRHERGRATAGWVA